MGKWFMARSFARGDDVLKPGGRWELKVAAESD